MTLKITVIGAGAWGTAIANLVAKNAFQTMVVTHKKDVVLEINNTQTNAHYLPDITLSANLVAVEGLSKAVVQDADLVFIVTPSQTVKGILKQIASYALHDKTGFVICSKGLDKENLQFFSQLCEAILPHHNYAILSGPNFALEVAQEVPTITTIASKDEAFARHVMASLQNAYFKAQYCDDPITTEIAAVLKNVMAIGCGIVDGLNLGQNAKAALVDCGIQEILHLCKALGGSGNLNNAAGFGDIFLTCSTTKSRNNALGFEMAKGKTYAHISADPHKTFEGAMSVKSIIELASKLGLQLNLCDTIGHILDQGSSIEEIKEKITKAILK